LNTGPGGRVKIGRDRKAAQQRLKLIDAEVAKGEYRPLRNIAFNEWAEEWFNGLRRPVKSTLRGYRPTLDYASAAFGSKLVRHLAATDVDDFLSKLSGLSTSTQAKHLRVLSSCLKAAVKRQYAAGNPVDALTPGERPRAEKNEAAYFEHDELPKLFSEFRDFDRPLFLAALKTGMRLGELLALTWGDVNLGERTIRVTKSYTAGIGVTPPKTEAGKRTVDIENGAVTLFEALIEQLGDVPSDDALVFPSTSGSYRSGSWIDRQLYKGMARAGLPRVGVTGKPRVFHSFRHTFAKVAMENGAQLPWLQRHMGHESLKVTSDIYGHFGKAARRLEVAKLEDAFNV
jgi:integrase